MLKAAAAIVLLLNIAAARGERVDITRQGRPVEIDGFLLEWDAGAARRWGTSSWTWDAVNTNDGLAGYFASHDPQICPEWTFTIRAGNAITFKIPHQTAGSRFAFDQGSFERQGIHVAEWIATWDLWNDDPAGQPLALDGASGCGDTLPTISITARRPAAKPPQAIPSYAVMAFAGALTLALVYLRRGRR